VNVTLKYRLFVTRNLQQCLQYPRGVGVETQDFTHTGPVLKMDPTASFNPTQKPSRQGSDDGHVVGGIGRRYVLLCDERGEFLAPGYPQRRIANDLFSSLNLCAGSGRQWQRSNPNARPLEYDDAPRGESRFDRGKIRQE
jgi:hypothetical protein